MVKSMIVKDKNCTDMRGTEVVVGDIVMVAITPYANAAMLSIGYVAAITAKSIICCRLGTNGQIPEQHMYCTTRKRYFNMKNNSLITGDIRNERQIYKL